MRLTEAGSPSVQGFSPPPLDEAQQRILRALRDDGIAISRFPDLFGDNGPWGELCADMEEFVHATEDRLAEPQQRKATMGKSFIVRRFLGGKERVRHGLENPWLRVSLSRPILDVVNSYRGEQTRLIDFDNWYTVPEPAADTRVKSQQWHRDPWDEHIVKVFVYFSEVDEEAGPFEYVPGSAPGGRYGHLWPWQPEGIYPPQDEFEATIPPSDWLTATGPTGTIIFCDTSGFHRGGWAKTKPRVLSVQTYVGSSSTKSPRFEFFGPADTADLSDAARVAISG